MTDQACRFVIHSSICLEHGVLYRAAACDNGLAALRRQLDDETAIVDRVWKALGIATYEQAEGKSIDEIVTTLRATVDDQARVIAHLRELAGEDAELSKDCQLCRQALSTPKPKEAE